MLNLYSILRLMIALLFIQSTAFGQTTQPYAPNAELAIKGGSHRSFGRLGLLIPLHQSPNHLLFTNIFGLYDTNNAAEINIGLGIRKMFQQHILGLTFFYDQRKSQHHINFPQITISTEYLTKNLEMRANLYIPLKGKTNIAKAKRIQRTPFGTLTQSQQLFEVPLKGFDVEMGGHINNIPWLSAHASYYHFHHRDIGHVPGFRARSALSINQHLNIEAEYSYDRLRKHNYFIGARLKFQMGKPQANSLAKKMTSMVVRDIDVVTTTNTFSQAQWSPSEAIPPEQTNNEQEQGPQTTQQQHITHADLRWAYQLLGLAPDATITDARRAYHRMAARVHPDRNPSPNANEQFIDLREAYQLIEQHLTTSQRAQAPVAQSTPAITPTMASSNAVTLYQPTATSPTTSVQTHHQAEQLTLEWTGPHQVQAHLASGHVIHIPREYIHWHFPPPADLPFEHFRQAITQQQVILAFDQEQEQIENISILPRGLGGMPKRARGECSGKTGDTQPTQGASERTDVVTAQGNGRRRVDSPQGRSSSSVTNRKRPREQSASPSNLSERTDVANTGNDKRRRVGNPNTPWDTGFRALLEQTNQFIQTPSSQSFQRMLLGPDVANAITQPNQVLLSTLAEMLPKLVISPHGFHSHVFKQVLCLLTLEGRTDHPRLNSNPWEVAYRLTKTFGRQAIFYLQETYQGHAGPTHPLAGYSFALPTNDNWSLIWQTWNHTFRSWDEYWQQQLFARATEIEKALPQHHASIHQLIHLTSERQKQTAAITALTNEMDVVRNKTKTTDPETKKFLIELLQLKQAALDTLEEKQASYQQALSQAEAKIDHPTLRQALSGFFKTMPHSGASTTPTSNTADAQMSRSLEDALKAGRLGKVRGLLERGANIKARNRYEYNALHLAAYSGNVELIRFLLNRKDSNESPLFDINDQGNFSKGTALMRAVRAGHLPAVQLLLENGANIKARNRHQGNALHLAADSGNVNLIRFLLNQKNSNGTPLFDVNNQGNHFKRSPLLFAVLAGHLPAIKALLDAGANIHLKNNFNRGILYYANASQNKQVIAFLKQAVKQGYTRTPSNPPNSGASTTPTSNTADTQMARTLEDALVAGDLGRVRSLLEKGANIRARNHRQYNALHLAATSGNVELIRFLLNRKDSNESPLFDINDQGNFSKGTALMRAVRAGHLPAVQLLLENGANIKARYSYQHNALHLAADSGKVDLIQFLLNQKDSNGIPLFDVNNRDNQFKTSPLLLAVQAGHLPAIKALLDAGANIHLKNNFNKGILYYANASQNKQVIAFVKQAVKQGYTRTPSSPPSTSSLVATTSNTADAQMTSTLENALVAGDLGRVRSLLENAANIKARNRDQHNALHLAADSGKVDLIRFLLNRKDSNGTPLFDVNDQGNKFKASPLLIAAAEGHLPAVQLLLEKGANIKARNHHQLNVLHSAAFSGNVELIRFLLNLKDSNGIPLFDVNDQGNKFKVSSLSLAAEKGHFPAVQLLLEKGANIKARNRVQANALHLAALSGNVELVRFLLNRKDSNGTPLFDVNNQGNQFRVSPLLFAAEKGHFPAVQLLLERGANIKARNRYQYNALHLAADSGKVDLIRFLLNRKDSNGTPLFDVNDQDNKLKYSPLLLAAKRGHLPAIKALLDAGANIHLKDSRNRGILYYANASQNKQVIAFVKQAVKQGYTRSLENALVAGDLGRVRSLLEKGANIKARNRYEYNALHLAACSGNVELIRFLLNLKDSNESPLFDINDQGNFSKGTALMRAVRAGHLPAVQLLLENGANIKARYSYQYNALHLAADSGKVDLIQFLLNQKDSNGTPLFDVNNRDNQFKTSPLLLAVQAGHLPAIKALLDAGANIQLKNNLNRGILYYANASQNKQVIAFVKQAVKQGYTRSLENALVAGDLGRVRSLLEKEADIKARYSYQYNALHLAACSGNVELIRFLLNLKDSNENPLLDINDQGNKFKVNPLLFAAEKGHFPAVQLLLEKGADIKARNCRQHNVLHMAAFSGNVELIRFLLNRKDSNGTPLFDVNDQGNKFKVSSLSLAAANGHFPAVQLLLEKGANIKARNYRQLNVLHSAAFSGNVELIRFLLNRKDSDGIPLFDVNDQGTLNKKTPLLIAVLACRLPAVQFLLEKGANIKARSRDQDNAIHIAASSGNVELIRFLLNLKDSNENPLLDINDQENLSKNTPLLCAALAGHLPAIKALLDAGANIHLKDSDNRDILHHANLSHSREVVDFVKQAVEQGYTRTPSSQPSTGSLVATTSNTADIQLTSTLEDALVAGDLGKVRSLLEKGANIKAGNRGQCNALHLAATSGNVELIEYLLNLKDSNEVPLFVVNEQGAFSKSTPLLIAVRAGHLQAVQLLLEKGANIKARNCYQSNALHMAATSGNVELIKFLLTLKDSNGIPLFDVNEQGAFSKGTPLLHAVRAGHLQAVQLLLEKGANIKAVIGGQTNALHLAASSGNVELIRFILNRKDSNGIPLFDVNRNDYRTTGSPLLFAAVSGHFPAVQLLLEKGANINARNYHRLNVLHMAAYSGNIELIRFLLNRKDSNGTPLFDVNDRETLNKSTPLLHAAEKGHFQAVQLLLERGANIKARNRHQVNVLHAAANSGNVELIRFLLNRKKSNGIPLFDVNIRDNQFKTSPLLLAAEKGHFQAVQLLLEWGANITARNRYQNNALHIAASSGNVELIRFLLNRKNSNGIPLFDVNSQDNQFKTSPLLYAAEKGNFQAVQLLLEKGADITARNLSQINALHLAASSGNVELIEFLLTLKDNNENPLFDVNDQDNELKLSPLLLAAEGGHLPAVQLLVERRAKTNATDHSGNNALHLAARKSHMEIALYLLELNHSEFPIINLLLQKNGMGITAFDDFFHMRSPALESPMNFLNRVRSSVSWPHIKHIITKYTHIDPRSYLSRHSLEYIIAQDKGRTLHCILSSISKEIRDLTPHLVRYTDTKFFFLQKFRGKYSSPTKAQVIEQINAMNDAQKDQLVQHYVNISSEINQAAELMGQWDDKKTLTRHYLAEQRIKLSRLSRFYSTFAPWLVPMLNKEQYQQLRLAVNQWKLLGLDLAKKYQGWSSAICLARQGLKMKFETLPELFETAISLIQARTMNDNTIEYANGLLELFGATSVRSRRLIETKQLVRNITDEDLTLCIHHLESDPSLSTNSQTGQARSMSLLDLLKEEHTKRKEEEANGMPSQDISESSEPPSEDDSTDSESTSEMPYNREFALTSSDDELSPTQGASPNPSKPMVHDNSGDEYIPSNARSTEEESSWWAPNDSSEDPSSDGDTTVTDMSEHESLSPGDDTEWEASDIRTDQESDITE